MTRVAQIALMLLVATGPATAQSPSPAEAVKAISDDWKKCVEGQIALSAIDRDNWKGPAQQAFDYCAAEEQLLFAAINLAAGESGARQALFLHHRNKVAWKKKITQDFFDAILKQMQKQ